MHIQQLPNEPPRSHERVNIHDCNAAIDLIPKGTLIFDPDPRHASSRHRPNLYLPERRRKFFLPTAFRSGSCIVSVLDKRRAIDIAYSGPPRIGADFLYFMVWPNARRLAPYILQKCPGSLGSVQFERCPENQAWFGTFGFTISVFAVPKGVIMNGTKIPLPGGLPDDLLNVYE